MHQANYMIQLISENLTGKFWIKTSGNYNSKEEESRWN